MRKNLTVVVAGAVSLALAGCGIIGGSDAPSKKSTPMPDNVPRNPKYDDAREVMAKLNSSGIPCKKKAEARTNRSVGTQLTCAASIDGTKFDNIIHVRNPEKVSRDQIGNSIAAGRGAPFRNTFAAGGNWYVRVAPPDFADRIARALGGVVLPPYGHDEDEDSPDPAARVPAKSAFGSLDKLADAVGRAVGCSARHAYLKDESATWQEVTCTTGIGAEPRRDSCAEVKLYDDKAARDEGLRTITGAGKTPNGVAAGQNWAVSLCQEELAGKVAKALGGVEVR